MRKYENPEMNLYMIPVDVITTSGDPADNLGDDNDFGNLPASSAL